MAKVIAESGRPALVLAHNKTLAAQLYGEFKEFFPENAVQYFVSYYDYYQPEAYIARSDTYIEKDSSRNEEIDRMRHSATRSLFERRDVIIVASVSCIYGLGAPVDYGAVTVRLNKGERVRRDTVLRHLVDIQYERTNTDLVRGKFRVRGDTLEIQPAYEDLAVRVEFFGDDVERITELDPLTGEVLAERDKMDIYPARHFVTPREKLMEAIKDIETELVDHGFRLPSALDNRPLTFAEFEQRLDQAIYVSATPGPYELEHSPRVIEQIIRPTGLIDPEIEVRKTEGQIDDLLAEINLRVERGQRAIVTTLTKKMAEDLADYLREMGVKVHYLHSEIETLQRVEILRDLRLGVYDVVVGVNLLREGIDLPEVTLVAILDADKEGYLRSEGSLIQVIGRAARHVEGRVIMYADRITASMKAAMDETDRRREIQVAYNTEHGIDPQTIVKAIRDIGLRLRDIADVEGVNDKAKRPLAAGSLPKDELLRLIKDLEGQMKRAAKDLEFEKAALLRDEAVQLRGLMVLEQGPESLEASAEPAGTTDGLIRAGGGLGQRRTYGLLVGAVSGLGVP